MAEARAERSGRVRRIGVTLLYSGNVPYARTQSSWFVFGGCLFVLVLLSLGCVACAQVFPGKVFDEAAAPGTNYEKAEFRLWYPDKARFVRAVVVLVPGANADGRPDANDSFWQAFANRNEIALIGSLYRQTARGIVYRELCKRRAGQRTGPARRAHSFLKSL
jgi:hypothetical protein